jgi:ABC-type antimicrobial peptide transport system permease subunit
MVLKQVVRMLLVGGAIGGAAAVGLGRAAESLLFGLEGWDAVVLAGGCGILTAIALTAAYFPARRAAHIDPIRALRQL